MNKTANEIKNRLSLRKPQVESLEILSEIADVLDLKKNVDLTTAKEKIKELGAKFDEVKKFSEFEREFPNVCFSLATGVGKTRLMGAFIAYLHIEKKINNFFVLAPNLTIYNKLIDDFGNPSSPIYLVETKKEKDMLAEEVQQKASAALEYCKNATEFTTKNGGKPWKYLLLPHNSVSISNDFNYFVRQYEYRV